MGFNSGFKGLKPEHITVYIVNLQAPSGNSYVQASLKVKVTP